MKDKLCDCYIIHVTETKVETNISNVDMSFQMFQNPKICLKAR